MILDLIDLIFWYFVILFKRKRELTQEWYGIVEKKKTRGDFSPAKYRYVVTFRKDDGKKKKLRMDRQEFDLYQEGKRYHKKIGDYFPDPKSAI